MDHTARQELMAEVDAVFAECLRHLPLESGQPDPGRPVTEFMAVLRTGERMREGLGLGGASARRANLMADGGTLRLNRCAWPELLLRKDDKIVALMRPGEPVFEIQAVDDRSHLRLVCELGDAR